MSFGRAHPREVRDGAMTQFIETWKTYSAPSAASAHIADQWEIGRTTLETWLRDEGEWPVTRAATSIQIQKELLELRRRLQEQELGHDDSRQG